MRLKRRHSTTPVIPTASMADIAFLLIVFFMLTMTFEKDKTQVALPATQLRFELPKEAAVISVTEHGQIRVSNGEEMSVPVSEEDVVTFGANVVAQFPGRPVVLKADEGVRYETIDNIIDSLKQAKVELIYLLSEQKAAQAVVGG